MTFLYQILVFQTHWKLSDTDFSGFFIDHIPFTSHASSYHFVSLSLLQNLFIFLSAGRVTSMIQINTFIITIIVININTTINTFIIIIINFNDIVINGMPKL